MKVRCCILKKLLSVLLLFSFVLCLASCEEKEAKSLTCEEIIAAYEDAGYVVEHHMHHETATEEGVVCSILIEDPKNPEKNYIYIDRYAEVEQAKAAAEEGKYNLATWFIFAMGGEGRWLTSESYGVLHYHTFQKRLTKPLKNLMG